MSEDKPLDKLSIEEMDKEYSKAMKGGSSPTYMVVSVPGVGMVEMTQEEIWANGSLATLEQVEQIREWMRKYGVA